MLSILHLSSRSVNSIIRDAKIKQIIGDVALEFENDDLQSQTGPITFLKRQQSLIQADKQLDQLLVCLNRVPIHGYINNSAGTPIRSPKTGFTDEGGYEEGSK